ncbi:uncharacterized protein [Choristoneura fumiferana]|uniref:uncharacterized protein n=1 Tax=Choristoneura fumiferana TaxID=7141 RepID=UPI003D15484B
MNKLLNLIFVAAAVACVYAAVGIYPAVPKPPGFADQEGCYLSKFNAVLPFNKPYFPTDDTSCEQYTCGTNGETQVYTCGLLAFSSNCHLVTDITLDYPKCCGDVVCDPESTTPPPAYETTEGTNEGGC